MVKILQIAGGLNRGGLETFIMNVYRAIDRTKVQFDFLIFSPNGAYIPEIEAMGGRVHILPARNQGYVKYLKNLNSFFRAHKNEYNAVHLHSSSLTSIEPLYFAKKYHVKHRMIHSHSSSISRNKIHYIFHYINKPFIRFLATNYYGCSDKAISWMFRWTGVLSKAKTIINGIDISKFSPNETIRLEIRSAFNIQDKFVIGHVGRFASVKNHNFLIDIFHEVYKKNNNTVLLCVGIGETFVQIQEKAKQLGIDSAIKFLGARSDIQDIMQGMDLFILPSLFEGFPVTLAEAQASGLPIIVSDTISRETNITGTLNYLSLKRSPKQWAEKVCAIAQNLVRFNNTKILTEAGFDIKSTATLLQNVYLQK
uniref:glycosyltransferase family 1 protein n=1 Tax=Alistipes sp. TaxID=1872444 RepID=UPI004057424D